MSEPLHFDDLRVGQSWRSRGRTVTETDVVNFACMTGDFDPLHVDYVAAEALPFHRPIAHGLLGLSWVAGLGSTSPTVASLAFVSISDWEFVRPIFFGDTLVAVNEVVRLAEKGRRRGHVVWRRKLLNQRGEVVQQGTFETIVARREAPESPAPTPAAATAPQAPSVKAPSVKASAGAPGGAARAKTAKPKIAKTTRARRRARKDGAASTATAAPPAPSQVVNSSAAPEAPASASTGTEDEAPGPPRRRRPAKTRSQGSSAGRGNSPRAEASRRGDLDGAN